jgi:predicted ATPase/FixJ family two-component response regulator
MDNRQLVYVVDDDASLRRSVKNLLSSSGVRVETFESAEAFLEHAERAAPACLILDLRLTGMTGLDLLARLSASGGHWPVVMLTGHGDKEARARALESGAVAVLTKPFVVEELLGAVAEATSRVASEVTVEPLDGLPVRAARLVGREAILGALWAELDANRLVTIVGVGGIGKTSVALAVAERMASRLLHGVCFVDLSMLDDERQLTAALAVALGVPVPAGDALGALTRLLSTRSILVVLDCCERAVDAARSLTEQLAEAAPGARFLATSRVPLRASGEHVHRLSSLEVPLASPAISAVEALGYPSVELFVERATQTLGTFRLSDADAPFVADVCRRLDGIPLAIELAASRIGHVGLRQLATGLDDPLRPQPGKTRASAPRHQTLRATLDWSHELLSAAEQVTFRRLAVFSGAFTLEAAVSIASDAGDTSGVAGRVLELVSKSLVSSDAGGPGGSGSAYRLLDMTRAYGFEKLAASGELSFVRRRHASHCLEFLRQAERDRADLSRSLWLSKYGRLLDDIRAALAWGFSESGDMALACELTAASALVGSQLSHHTEWQGYAALALGRIEKLSPPNPMLELRLTLAFGDTAGDEQRQLAALGRTLRLAEQVGEGADPALMLEVAWSIAFRHADYPMSLALAERHRAVSGGATDPNRQLNHDRIMAISLLYNGELARSRELAESVIERLEASGTEKLIHPFLVQPHVSMRTFLARTAWFEGFPERAIQLAQEALERAWISGNVLSVAYALCFGACPVALWMGDVPASRRFLSVLVELCDKHSLDYWRVWASCFSAALSATGQASARALTLNTKQRDQLCTIAEAAVAQESVARAEAGQVPWAAAEILRARGVALLRQGLVAKAEAILLRSREIARSQKALAWELRTVTSLARLWREQGREAEARESLQHVLAGFTEGLTTADPTTARLLLGDLGG